MPSRAPRPAEQPRTKSISDASGKRKRESRLCHLEAAAPSRSAGKRASERGNREADTLRRSLRVRTGQRPATSPRRPPPRPERSRPLPAPRPRPPLRWSRRWRLSTPPMPPLTLASLELLAVVRGQNVFSTFFIPGFSALPGPQHAVLATPSHLHRAPPPSALGGQSAELRAAGARPGCAAPGYVHRQMPVAPTCRISHFCTSTGTHAHTHTPLMRRHFASNVVDGH